MGNSKMSTDHDVPRDSSIETEEQVTASNQETKSSMGNWALLGPITAAFAIVVSAAVVAAYRFGEGVVYIGDRTISDMNMFEVTGGAAVGVFGALIGLGAAAIGAVATLIAGIVGLLVGTLGMAVGFVIAAGVLTGPVLLVGLAVILVKRRYWPDVI